MPFENKIGYSIPGFLVNGNTQNYKVAANNTIAAGDFVEISNNTVKSFGTTVSGIAKTSGSAGQTISVWVPIN